MLADIEKNEINLITEEKISHFTWISNDKFLLFQRLLPKNKKNKVKLLHRRRKDSESQPLGINTFNKIIVLNMLKVFFKRIFWFVLYKIKSNKIKRKIISFNLLGIDCHPFYNDKLNKLFLDSYPNDKKKINIFSINLNNKFFDKKEIQILGNWETCIGKVDAHIRLSENSNYACIDSVFKKVRVVKIFKISNKID